MSVATRRRAGAAMLVIAAAAVAVPALAQDNDPAEPAGGGSSSAVDATVAVERTDLVERETVDGTLAFAERGAAVGGPRRDAHSGGARGQHRPPRRRALPARRSRGGVADVRGQAGLAGAGAGDHRRRGHPPAGAQPARDGPRPGHRRRRLDVGDHRGGQALPGRAGADRGRLARSGRNRLPSGAGADRPGEGEARREGGARRCGARALVAAADRRGRPGRVAAGSRPRGRRRDGRAAERDGGARADRVGRQGGREVQQRAGRGDGDDPARGTPARQGGARHRARPGACGRRPRGGAGARRARGAGAGAAGRPGGGYAVEVAGRGIVGVQPGVFAGDQVAVEGDLREGDRVVVAE